MNRLARSTYLSGIARSLTRMDSPRMARHGTVPYRYDEVDIATYTKPDFERALTESGTPLALAQRYSRENGQRRIITTHKGTQMLYSMGDVFGIAVVDREHAQSREYMDALFRKLKTTVEDREATERRRITHV